MTRDEIIAAYRFAGVPDPERMTAAFIASTEAGPEPAKPALAVPACPSCQAAPPEIAWTGGSPPHGGDSWRCSGCGYTWTTPPARGRP